MYAGGLNEYIWQAWAYLESNQNNVGQARKVCAGFLAVCEALSEATVCSFKLHSQSSQELSIPTWLTMPLPALDSFSLAGFFTSTLMSIVHRWYSE